MSPRQQQQQSTTVTFGVMTHCFLFSSSSCVVCETQALPLEPDWLLVLLPTRREICAA
jgi:hypothetical protein